MNPHFYYYPDMRALRAAVMAEQERRDSRPKCSWPIGNGQCGSEEHVYRVRETSGQESDICRKHLPDVIGARSYDTAVPLDTLPEKQ